MFYNFANAQPIRAIENNGTSTSTITSLLTNGFDLEPSPTLTIEVLALVPEVDQPAEVVVILIVEDQTSPLISTKMAWEGEQQNSWGEASPKRTRDVGDDASGEELNL